MADFTMDWIDLLLLTGLWISVTVAGLTLLRLTVRKSVRPKGRGA